MAVREASESSDSNSTLLHFNELQLCNAFRRLGYPHQGNFQQDIEYVQARLYAANEDEHIMILEQLNEKVEEDESASADSSSKGDASVESVGLDRSLGSRLGVVRVSQEVMALAGQD